MDFSKKDNVFTIPLPGSDLVFTRYLYVKEEVRIALLVSILNKREDAVFWAYELYYSGFKCELFNLFWKVYYDYFATLNPDYESYLLKIHKEFMSTVDDEDFDITMIASIVKDLLFRPFNADVFFLRNICEQFEIDTNYHHGAEKMTHLGELTTNMTQWIADEDFRSIAQWVLNVNKFAKPMDVYNVCTSIFVKDETVRAKLSEDLYNILQLNLTPNVILLAKIMQLFSRKYKLKKGKDVHFPVAKDYVMQFDSLVAVGDLKNYHVLKQAYKCGIDDLKHLSLFKLTRNKYDLKNMYFHNWEYHASFSPIWLKRLGEHKGFPDYVGQCVKFAQREQTDELMQSFYELYGLEPDEQSVEVQEKSVGCIEKVHNWQWFYDTYKRNGLVFIYEEELEEFDADGLKY